MCLETPNTLTYQIPAWISYGRIKIGHQHQVQHIVFSTEVFQTSAYIMHLVIRYMLNLLFIIILWCCQHQDFCVALNDRIIDVCWIWMDLEGSYSGLIKVISQHLLEDNHDNLRIAFRTPENRTKHILNTSHDHYCLFNLFGAWLFHFWVRNMQVH
jgi:hypothetical protein